MKGKGCGWYRCKGPKEDLKGEREEEIGPYRFPSLTGRVVALTDERTGGRVGHGLLEDQVKGLILGQHLGLSWALLAQRVTGSLRRSLRGGVGGRRSLVFGGGGLEEGRHV